MGSGNTAQLIWLVTHGPFPEALFNEFKRRGVSFVKELPFIDQGLWRFEVNDADGYIVAFFQLRNHLS